MLNTPLLKFEKSTSFLNNQLHIQENNKQLILDIIANLGLILNTTKGEKKDNFNKLLKKANNFLNTITNNVTQIEQLNLEISNIANELTKVLAEYKKASKSKAFYIASFSNIKNNIASYVEKFQALEIKIEKENKKFNKFINDNNFKYNFESKDSANNDTNTFSFTGFSVNDEEIVNDDKENFFEKFVNDNESIDNPLPTTDISNLSQSDSHNQNSDQAISLEPIEDDNFENDIIVDNEDENDTIEDTSSTLEEELVEVDEENDEEEIDTKQERINSLTKEFKEILTDLSNGKINKDDIEPMIINCFNEVANLPDPDAQTNAVLSQLDALDHEEEENKSLLDQEITDKDFEEIEKNNAIDMANKLKEAEENENKNDEENEQDNSDFIPDNTEIFENQSNNIFSHFSLNDSTITLEEVVDDDYDEEDDEDTNTESFETVDDTDDISLDDIDVEDLIDTMDDLPLNDTELNPAEENNNVTPVIDNNENTVVEEKEEIKEVKATSTSTHSCYNNCFTSFSTIQDDIYNEYDSFKPIANPNNIVTKFKPLPKVEKPVEVIKEEPKSFAKFELKPEPIKSPKDLRIDIYDDSFESLQPKKEMSTSINPKYLETLIPEAITPNFNNSPVINKPEEAAPIAPTPNLTANIHNLIIDDNLDDGNDLNILHNNNILEPIITNTIDSLDYEDFNIDDIDNLDLGSEKISNDNDIDNDSISIEDSGLSLNDTSLDDIDVNDIDVSDINIDDIDINDISLEDIESTLLTDEISEPSEEVEETEELEELQDNSNFSDELLNSSYTAASDFNNLHDDLKIDLINEKIEKIEQATQDNETLIISERKNKVYLPYKITELMKYVESYPNVYESLANVVEQEFILPFNYFSKHPFKSRFTETYNLIRNREGYSAMSAIQFGLKLIPKTNLNPVVIAACKNQTELKSLLYHLDEDDLNNFKYFNIIFDVNPVKTTKYK